MSTDTARKRIINRAPIAPTVGEKMDSEEAEIIKEAEDIMEYLLQELRDNSKVKATSSTWISRS